MDVHDERAAGLIAKFRRVSGERVAKLQASVERLAEAPIDGALVAEIKRELHTMKGEARVVGFALAADVAHALEELFVMVSGLSERDPYREGLSEGLDLFSELVGEQAQHADGLEAGAAGFIAEVRLVTAAHAAQTQPVAAASKPPTSIPAVEVASSLSAPPANAEQPAAGAPVATAQATQADQFIPVSASRLAALTSGAAELSIRQDQLERSVADLERLTRTAVLELELLSRAVAQGTVNSSLQGSTLRRDFLPKLIAYTREMQSTLSRARDELFDNQLHLTALQDEIRDSRLVRFDELFHKHARGMRELARDQGKQVRVITEEHEVAVDKQVLERLDEALLHLARNAIDHAVERPEDRSRCGKSPRAEVRLVAREVGEFVEIALEDDGRGVDVSRIRQTAVERGLLTEDQARRLSEQDALMLIFQPNFSTRATVSDLSGRGIGLNIVQKTVSDLDGTLRVESEVGRGTRFVMRVPISTAFAKALVIKSGKHLCALPTTAVERIVYAGAEDIERVGHGEAYVHDGARVPIMSLQQVLGQQPSNTGGRLRTVLLLPGPPRIALEVDGLVGQRETLRRKLNPLVAASTLVNGTGVIEGQKLVLFLNVGALTGRSQIMIGRPAPTVAAAPTTRERGRILFVDDSELTRDMIVSLLQRAGFTVREAADGADAWEAIQRDPPDLVLTDLDMPVMDGFTLVQRIRATPRLRELPVVVLSTRGSDQDKRRAMECGADAYVVKASMRSEDLSNTLSAYLQRENNG